MDSGEHYDGHPKTAGQYQVSMTGRHADFSLAGLREGVVVDRRYVDQDGNRSRVTVEYDVRDILTGQRLTGVWRVAAAGGLDDGDDLPLRVASKTLDGKPITRYTRADNLDGDHVVFGFIEGSRTRAVILGVRQHTGAKYGAKAEDGERRFSTHKGTSWLVDKSGNVQVKHKSGATLVIDDEGNIIGTPADGKKFKAGGSGGEPAALGDKLTARLEALESRMSTISSHTHEVANAVATASAALVKLPIVNPPNVKAQNSENK